MKEGGRTDKKWDGATGENTERPKKGGRVKVAMNIQQTAQGHGEQCWWLVLVAETVTIIFILVGE